MLLRSISTISTLAIKNYSDENEFHVKSDLDYKFTRRNATYYSN